MHENNEGTTGTLSAMQPDLEYIPVRSDPRRVSVSEMYEEDPELEESYDQDKQQPTLFEVMEKICRIVECVTCGGMIYVLARMAGIA
jgi:hypothetical protein